jgi:hypothetical protein
MLGSLVILKRPVRSYLWPFVDGSEIPEGGPLHLVIDADDVGKDVAFSFVKRNCRCS